MLGELLAGHIWARHSCSGPCLDWACSDMTVTLAAAHVGHWPVHHVPMSPPCSVLANCSALASILDYALYTRPLHIGHTLV